MKSKWFIVGALVLAGCAHESKVQPSSGHIDANAVDGAKPPTSANIPAPVRPQAYVPPPRAKPKEQTYSVVVNEVPVKEILFALARESKLNIDIHPSIQGRVTLNAVDQTLPAILERLAKQVDLTYRMEGNVLTIAPDQPVLRSYKIDYVNMARDTTASVGVASEIASTGRAASTGGAGTSASGGGSATNSSRTLVSSESKNRFWETLIANVKDILAETDKEVLITRTGNVTAPPSTVVNVNAGQNPAVPGAAAPAVAQPTTESLEKEREDARNEYKTLFAATVIANPETGIINVRATSKQHERVQEFLDRVMHSAKRQVLIEATIVEVTLNDINQAGIEWSKISGNFNFTQALGTTGVLTGLTSTGQGLALSGAPFVIGYDGGNDPSDLNVTLRLLRQFGDTKVLSSPKLMVLNNQTAILKVVDNLVYFTIEAETNANQTNTQTTFTTTPHTIPVGVVMSVTPQVNESESVMLNVRPTISQRIGDISDPNPSLRVSSDGTPLANPITSTIPVIQVREMESLLEVRSGQTAVLGGLMQDQIARSSDNVPGLYKLPIIGKAFTARNDINRKTELVIFIRPTVIQNASLESEELQSFQQFLPSQKLQETLDESAN
ncbi:MAG TPA: pilus (MSHA type) biogenesis protein MshL [Methylophilaceae bacterium]|nr:pilus (MSHA type) biogenesis protein MshL [Methylophilaceae bacterium]